MTDLMDVSHVLLVVILSCVCVAFVLPLELKAQQEPMLTCELCGRVDFAYIFKRSKRFCSTVCAKR